MKKSSLRTVKEKNRRLILRALLTEGGLSRIELAKQTGLSPSTITALVGELLAEGVETEEQVKLLRKIGCDNVQGYYYAKPMPVEDFFELLQKDRQSINSL